MDGGPGRLTVGAAAGLVVLAVVWRAASEGGVGVLGPALALTVGVGASLMAARLGRLAARNGVLEAELALVGRRTGIDPLTGLPDRERMAAELDRRLAEREADEVVGVLFVDLDRLGLVSDSLGHRAGDQVVAVAARRLAGVVRTTDSLGRFGDDRLVVVSAGLPSRRDLEILAGRLLEALRRPTVLADGSAHVVCGTVGIAQVVGDRPVSAEELMRDAGLACSRARRDGGDRHAVFEDADRAEATARLALEQELRAALRDDEIRVHYQPIVDAGTGVVDRVEALVRWDHPRRGTVLPSEFLPVAAESPLIVELGRVVLAEACRQAVEWSERFDRPISVAVNVAERQLLDRGLVEEITRVLATTGLPARQLELEVSEDLILERLDHSLVVLRQLDLLGVRLAIDDFGTSRASLGRLKQLAMVSSLKIDRALVTDLAGGPGDGQGGDGVDDGVDRKIAAAVVALAASVGMAVVAEGVETTAQARILRDLGVDHLQGFLFGRPGPASAVEAALAGERPHRWSA
jgi:diguanylate cyclase (GGDEF)-like protein